MTATIKDIAKAAGVSISAVSYALNNSGPVSREKRERILQLAKEMDYVPSGIARSLKLQKKGFVGYCAYSLAGSVFGPVMKGIEDVFHDTGQEMVACSFSPETTRVTKLLTEKMVDGAIIFAEYIEDSLLKRLANADFPIVVLDRDLHDEYISCILIENQEGAYQVGTAIHKRGMRRVGYIYGSGFDGKERRKGFLKAVSDYQFLLDPVWEIDGEWQDRVTCQKIQAAVKSGNLPEVIFAFNDEMAKGCMEALQSAGYRIPEDVSVIGLDDIAVSEHLTPSLTTVRRPMYDLGVLAAQTLDDMLHGKPGVRRMLPTEIIWRESFQKNDSKRNQREDV